MEKHGKHALVYIPHKQQPDGIWRQQRKTRSIPVQRRFRFLLADLSVY
jgi:hypothetical protein